MACISQCCGSFCKEFKAYVFILTFLLLIFFQSNRFALRGNVLDLAIGIIIGTAFTSVVQSLVDDIITPPLGFIMGGVDFVNLTIKMENFIYKDQPPVVIRYGKFIQTIISLTIVAFALFFVIQAINHLHKIAQRNKTTTETDIEIEVTDELEVLREIRDLLAQQSSVKFSSNQV
ncbi:unnamed protein product [Rotaria sp. Silwood2]|nr:unnamed protein product [Rotaria sp. Silwood2]CAF4538026.1 unnamed protein product [Rotaria sp. Silwood2]